MVSIKVKPAEYYQAAFKNNLTLVGVEDNAPVWLGSDIDFMNFEEETKNL